MTLLNFLSTLNSFPVPFVGWLVCVCVKVHMYVCVHVGARVSI